MGRVELVYPGDTPLLKMTGGVVEGGGGGDCELVPLKALKPKI